MLTFLYDGWCVQRPWKTRRQQYFRRYQSLNLCCWKMPHCWFEAPAGCRRLCISSWVRWYSPSRRISDDSTAGGARILSERAASIKMNKSYTILQVANKAGLVFMRMSCPYSDAIQGENARGVYNWLGVHWNTKQLLELCIATYLPRTAFMQQEFNTAVATMNMKPTSSFIMHIFWSTGMQSLLDHRCKYWWKMSSYLL